MRYPDLLTGNSHMLELGRFRQGIINILFSTGMLENDSLVLRLRSGLVESPL